MTRVDWAIAEFVGGTVSGVVVKRDNIDSWQASLVFDDGTYFKLFEEGYF